MALTSLKVTAPAQNVITASDSRVSLTVGTSPGPAGPPGFTATWRGIWLIGTTYTAGPPPDGVIGSNGHWYISLTNGNVGNNPVTDGGVHWQDLQVAITSSPNIFTTTQTFQGPSSGSSTFETDFGPLSALCTDSGANWLASITNLTGSALHHAGQISVHATNGLGPGGAAWYFAVDTAAATPYRDLAIAKFTGGAAQSDVDGIYISHGGAGPATIGIGQTTPGDYASGAYRLKILGDSPTHQGCLQLLTNAGQTGHALNVKNPSNNNVAFIDLNGNAWATTLGAGNNNSAFAGANTLDIRTTGNCTFQMVGGGSGAFVATALSGSAAVTLETSNSSTLTLGTINVGAILIDINQGVVVGPGAQSTPAELATTATTGLFRIPTVNGTPTGAPAATTGAMPIVYDRSANKLWVYNGSWRGVVLA